MAQQARRNTNLTMVIVAVIAIAALAVILIMLLGDRNRTAAIEVGLDQAASLAILSDRLEPNRIEAIEGRTMQLHVVATEGDHTIEIPPLVQQMRVLDQQTVTINLTAPTPGVYPIIVEGPTGRFEGELVILEAIGQEVPPREPAGGPAGQ
jgi:heme/copper-type cytochrome/quinol oxidase subunit 2